MNSFGFGQGGNYLLDKYPVGTGSAWSMRKLISAYTGPCVRLRRSSDNAELDVGFIGERFDTAAYLTFRGASVNVFVVKWYDQSGNARHWAQTTAVYQPYFNGTDIQFASTFVVTGVVGDNHALDLTNVFGNSAAAGNYLDYFLAIKFDDALTSFLPILAYDTRTSPQNNGWGYIVNNQANPRSFRPHNSGGTISLYRSNVFDPVFTINSFYGVTSAFAWQIINPVMNGWTTNGNNIFRMGWRTDQAMSAGICPNMKIRELIIYQADKSAVRTKITDNIMEAHAIR